jgi:uncharacterized SAM-binding protein YcdF (DUF218 family)
VSAEFPSAQQPASRPHYLLRALLWIGAVLFVLLAVFAALALKYGATFLRVNHPEYADVILVLGGGVDDSRYWRGVELMKAGYAGKMVLDAEASDKKYGKSNADLANEFLASVHAQHATVCPVYSDSTFGETEDVARCLAPMKVSSVLIVTSDYHTRRAFDIFKARLPRYHWSIAGVYAPYEDQTTKRLAGDNWWRNRRWAKTVADEWERLIWWELVDRWRAHPVIQG